ncbi:hypothetical protein [Wenyingzhuangia sp. IMCC45574]
MNRRDFIELSAMLGVGVSLPFSTLLSSCVNDKNEHSKEFKNYTYSLLKEWCDEMLKLQIINPSDKDVHGALGCPSCSHIHGRCMDAVYPFLYMADVTGDQKYLKGAILVMQWAENNVSQANGAWTVIKNPKSWKGITVFGAIALAEALKYHGHILDAATKKAWTDRLHRAAEYIYKVFTISFTNINYGGTAIYGLSLFGEVLKVEKYLTKSKELATDVKDYFTDNETFLFGECKKESDKLSEKGLHGVDLGYNVEETLNSLAMYAVKYQDEELLTLVEKSLTSHLEFMLPDGAWDNSWGTRQYKWSYWGSRTCDGSQLAYAVMADMNPAFATAAIKNTELLKECTSSGLIHGGPHFVSHGVKPCVHHTFTHAKPLATLLDHWEHLPQLNKNTPLPRLVADGVKHVKDLDVFLFARGDWRGTVSTYDAEYHYSKDFRQACGGALGVLYHNKVGLLSVASMAVYEMVEKNNQQPQPGVDFALTPRIETFVEDEWYTNLFDLNATATSSDKNGVVELIANVSLKNASRKQVSSTAANFSINYQFDKDKTTIKVKPEQKITNKTSFVLPIVSKNNEEYTFTSDYELVVKKEGGAVVITSNAKLNIREIPTKRVFNMVPGVEALPLEAFFNDSSESLILEIKVV